MSGRCTSSRTTICILLSVIVLSGTFAGCIDDGPATTEGDGSPSTAEAMALWDRYLADPGAGDPPNITETAPFPDEATTVVAVIDSGINPFHQAFARPTTRPLGSVPIPAIDATTGEAARYAPVPEVDSLDDPEAQAYKAALDPRTLYRMAGTPFYYYNLQETGDPLDSSGHGTHAAASLLQGGPDAFVVVVHTGLSDEETAEALRWAAAQPWIDIVTMSRGYVLNGILQRALSLRDPGIEESAREVVESSRAVWDSGKLLFISAGNDPTLAATDPYGGPPWCILVGGYDPYWNGESMMASKGVDIVGHFSVEVARHDAVEGTIGSGGTSFAAPMAAGVTAQALLTARTALGHIGSIRDGQLITPGPSIDAAPTDNHAVRQAINGSASYPAVDDLYDPSKSKPPTQTGDGPETLAIELIETAFQSSIPINPVAPWVQMGWGLIGPDEVDPLAQALMENPGNEKPEAAQFHMTQQARLRDELWQDAQAPIIDLLPH